MKYLKKSLLIGYILYLIIDIFHFINVRLKWKEIDGVYFHLHYESIPVSIAKWIFCLVSLMLIFDFVKINVIKQHLIICIISGVIVSTDIIFGPFRSSLVGKIMLLDILSFLAIIYYYIVVKLDFKVRLFHYMIAGLVCYLLYKLNYIGELFYL